APDGKTLASGSGALSGAHDQTVRLWDVGTSREISRVVGHEGTVCSVAFTPDGQDIVSSGWEGSARLWDAGTGKQRRQVAPVGEERPDGSSIAGIASAVSADGKVFLSAAAYRTEAMYTVKVRRWEQASGRELPGWSHELGEASPQGLQWLTISLDGAIVVCAANQTYLWEAATGKELARIAETYRAISPDGKLAVCLPQQR